MRVLGLLDGAVGDDECANLGAIRIPTCRWRTWLEALAEVVGVESSLGQVVVVQQLIRARWHATEPADIEAEVTVEAMAAVLAAACQLAAFFERNRDRAMNALLGV